jgi:alpha-D-xyloside xylohydrolase
MNGIGNTWHIPTSVEPRSTMRDPLTGISATTSVSIFSGSQFQGPGTAGNQLEIGSTVFFRRSGDASWSSVPLRFDSAAGNNKYYVATLPGHLFHTGDFIEYYLRIPFSDHATTFIRGSDNNSVATPIEMEAQTHPFSFTVQGAANFVAFDSGALQARVFMDSGQFALAGPDLQGTAHANVITFFPPAVRVGGKALSLGPIRETRTLANGLELVYHLGGETVITQLTFPSEGVMQYEVVQWNSVVAEQTIVTAPSDDTEHFFGFGEKFDALDQSGKVVHTLTMDDPGVKGGHSYKAGPWFISTRGYGFHLDSSAESHFDMRASHADRYTITNLFSTLRFKVVYGPSLPDVLKRFTAYSGRPFLPPPWVFGPWISSDIWRSGGEIRYAVMNFVGNLKGRGIPASAIVFDSPWETAYNDFQFNMTQFGKGEDFEGDHYDGFASLSEMMEFFQNHGLKLICWMAPFINVQSDPETLPNRFQSNGALERVPGQNLGKASNYGEGERKGFFVRKAAGGPALVVPWWKGRGSPVDFTNVAARMWFTDQLQALLTQSEVVTAGGSREPTIGGFKTDDGETQNTAQPPNVYIPVTAAYSDGRKGTEMRNAYCLEYQQCVSDVLGSKGVLFARSGFVGCQAFPGHWPGDNEPNFGVNGLASVIVAGLSAAMSGYSIWGHDVGGYQNSNFGVSAADRADLFMRWTQFACFSPIMQMHRQVHSQRKQDFTPGKTEELRQYPWGYGAEGLANYQFFARLHTRLFPYIYTYAKESNATGLPIMRPLVLVNQGDLKVLGIEHAYHFGKEFLVAPILVLNADFRQVYLPDGNWVDFWTSARHVGNQTITWKSLNRKEFPLFVREGGIVPMLPENVQTLCDPNYVNNAAIPVAKQDLMFLVYPSSGTSQFTVYDQTQIQCQRSGTTLSISLNSMARPVTLQVSGDEPPDVTLNSLSLQKQATLAEFDTSESGWRYDSASRFLYIKFPHTGGSAEVRC